MTCLWLGYWALVFIIMHLPKPRGVTLVLRLGDKLVHGGVYFVLALLGGWAAWRLGRRLDLRWATRWWLIYAIYAAADELLQPLFSRHCQLSDWIADVTGAALALVLVRRLARSHRPAQRSPQDSQRG